jgi:hypothetical protein
VTIVVSIIGEPTQRNPPAASPVTACHRDDPRSLLRLLRASLVHEDTDPAEFTVYSVGDDGALLYPTPAQPLSAFRRLLGARPLPPSGASVLRVFILRIPAERHAVRLRCGGGVSIFFKIDLPLSGVVGLCSSMELDSLGAEAVELSESLSRAPCGVAVEARAGSGIRVRLYWMASGEAADLVALHACRRLGLRPSQGDELARVWRRLTPYPDRVVLNISGDPGSAPALKLELPAVEVARAAELVGADGAASRAFQSALALQTAPHRERHFPYVGVRWSGGQVPDLTFNVDARGTV